MGIDRLPSGSCIQLSRPPCCLRCAFSRSLRSTRSVMTTATIHHVPGTAGTWSWLLGKSVDQRAIGPYTTLGSATAGDLAVDVAPAGAEHHIAISVGGTIVCVCKIRVAPVHHFAAFNPDPSVVQAVLPSADWHTIICVAEEVHCLTEHRGAGYATTAMCVASRLAKKLGAHAIFGQSLNPQSSRWT